MQPDIRQQALTCSRRRKAGKRWGAAARILACLVVFCTVYTLILPAMTAEGETFCGKTEHIHTETCYGRDGTLTCTLEEHAHSLACYADPRADVESEQVWAAGVPAPTGAWGKDLLAAAESQLGYRESEKNFRVRGDNSTAGYTRYGDWAGDPYGDWNFYFVKFCMHYAGLPGGWFESADRESVLRALLGAENRLTDAGKDILPREGDLVFLQRQGRTAAGVVQKAGAGYVTAILGDENNAVCAVTFPSDAPELLSYGRMGPEEGLQPAGAVTGTDINMQDMITEVHLQHRPRGSGDDVPWADLKNGDQVQEDDQIRGIITYRVPENSLLSGDDLIYYQMPAGLKLQGVEQGIVYNTSGQEVGTYSITPDGRAAIRFYEYYVAENQKGQPIVGRLTFEGSLNKSAVGENGKLEMLFNENCRIDLEVVEAKPAAGDIFVDKKVNTETESGRFLYTIEISSTQGTFGPVRLTDQMQYQSFTETLAQELQVVDEKGQKVDFTLHTKPNDTWNFQLDLPAMKAGGRYVITYPAFANENTAGMTLTNRATAGSVDSQNTPIDSSDGSSFQYDMLRKTGVYDAQADATSWTVQINGDRRDISGWTLVDRYLDAGGWHPYEGTAVLRDTQGREQTVQMPYTFPEGSREPYEVTYTIPRGAMDLGSNTVLNEVRLVKNGREIVSASGTVGVGTFAPLQKTGGEITRFDAAGNAILPWTVTMDFTRDSTHHGYLGFDDILLQSDLVQQYFTREQLENAGRAVAEAFEQAGLTAQGWKVYRPGEGNTLLPWPEETETEGRYTGFHFEVAGDIPKGTVMHFSYESTGVLAGGRRPLVFPNRFMLYQHGADAEIPYLPKDLTVEKIDPSAPDQPGSGHFMHDLTNGRLKWLIRTFIPEHLRTGPAVVTEELPEHVDLEELSMTVTVADRVIPGIFSFGTGTTASVQISENGRLYEAEAVKEGRILRITLPRELTELVGGYFEFGVTVKIRDGEVDWQKSQMTQSAAFANRVSVTAGPQTGEDIQTQVITKNDLHGVISKQGSRIEDTNLVEYKIVVNPNSVDLVPGGDTLLLEDILSFDNQAGQIHASLVPGSVKVFAQGTQDRVPAQPTYENQSAGSEEKHVLHVTVPDQQALVVTYKYRFYGKLEAAASVRNTASLNSIQTEDEDNQFDIRIQIQESGAVAELRGITVIKVNDKNFDIFLPGARFRLKAWNGSAYEELAVVETDQEGKIQLNKDKVNGMTYNTAYQLQEIEAPENYLLDPTPYEFIIANEDTVSFPMNVPENFGGHRHQNGDQQYITNEENTTMLRLEKSWVSDTGHPLGNPGVDTVTVRVYQQTGQTDKALYGTYTLRASEGWKLTLSGLPAARVNPDGTKGSLYFYTVEEVPVPGFSVGYENNSGISGGTVRLINRQESGYILPETGGHGRLPWLLGGAGCLLLALFLFLSQKRRERAERH